MPRRFEERTGVLELLLVLLGWIGGIDGTHLARADEHGSNARHDQLGAEGRGEIRGPGERALRGLALVISDNDGLHRALLAAGRSGPLSR